MDAPVFSFAEVNKNETLVCLGALEWRGGDYDIMEGKKIGCLYFNKKCSAHWSMLIRLLLGFLDG